MKAIKKSPKRFGTRYPWERWFAKRKFTLKSGRDYTCYTHTMSTMARQAGARMGYHVSIRWLPDETGLVVTVRPK